MTTGTLWLVGMMGSGKSTVGPLVAARLGRRFVDLDQEVEASAGKTVADLIRRDDGAFREHEHRVLADTAGRSLVVGTGGGVVLDERNVAAMRRSGLVVWLEAPVQVLAERVGSGVERPLLAGDPRAALDRILTERLPRYRSAAHVVVDATGPPDEVTSAVVAAWEGS